MSTIISPEVQPAATAGEHRSQAARAALRSVPALLAQPLRLLRSYPRSALRADLVAGVTVGVVLLPQALAFSLLAGLPPTMGLYAGIVATIVGALWGSSSHLHTGPTNTASILTLSVLLTVAEPGTPRFIIAAGLLAVMAGGIRLLLGLARLGLLVNFVSGAVSVGFTAGAGILIMSNQLEPLLRLDLPPVAGLLDTLRGVVTQARAIHLPSLAIGLVTIGLTLAMQRLSRKLPAVLVGIAVASLIAWGVGLERQGVRVLGALPSSLPPLAALPLLDLDLIGKLANGALALAIIGLVEAVSIARGVASLSRQRLDSNQEFVGQGLANIAAGFFSGYPCSGSFNRSALSYQAGAQTALASVVSGGFVLVAMFTLTPLIAHLPRPVLAGTLLLTAYSMVDRRAIARIWRGARGDAAIMLVTLVATLLLPLQFAVLIGVLLSLGYYLFKTSAPRLLTVVPDDRFRHFVHQPHKPVCPQLGIMDILGDLYFGATSHIETAIYRQRATHPSQRFLLLRMHSVNYCDLSGIEMLESVVRTYRDQGGDVFLVRVQAPLRELMRTTGFEAYLGTDHILSEDEAIEYLFYKVLDPAICIYESGVRVFRECQNLPRPDYTIEIPLQVVGLADQPPSVPAQTLWQQLRSQEAPLVVDVREPREFKRGHIPQARLLPLARLLSAPPDLPRNRPIVLVCESGRRSTRAAAMLRGADYDNLTILQGGMLAWAAAELLQAVD